MRVGGLWPHDGLQEMVRIDGPPPLSMPREPSDRFDGCLHPCRCDGEFIGTQGQARQPGEARDPGGRIQYGDEQQSCNVDDTDMSSHVRPQASVRRIILFLVTSSIVLLRLINNSFSIYYLMISPVASDGMDHYGKS